MTGYREENKLIMDKNAPIGVFDSGVGGLTVAREIMRQIPNERIVYFGDTARVPYGSKSKDNIIKFSRQIIRFLQTENVKAIVIACNTASALALDEMQQEFDLPILGVVKPGAKVAVETTANKRIGLIGTEANIRSGVYTRYIKSLDDEAKVFEKACPLFVPLVEEGWLHDDITLQVASRYLEELKEKDIDKSDEQTQKEWEEDVTSFLALHNTLLNSLKRIDTDVMTKYAKELQSNAKEYEKALEEMGIVIDDSGAFSISKEGLVQSDNEKWQEFVKKTQALSKETQTSAKSSLDSITTNRILHGISYNKYGKES